MASITFANGTLVPPSWLNDVNALTYGIPLTTGSALVGFDWGVSYVAQTVGWAVRLGNVISYAQPQSAGNGYALAQWNWTEATVPSTTNAFVDVLQINHLNGGGSVVAFSCNSTLYHYPWMTAFTASKSAVDSMITSLANEFSGDNLRFNSLRLS